LHYSDTWADPGKQIKPSAWSSLSTTDLIAKVKSYTTTVLDAFAAQNLDVQLVSIGNEIRAGLLWPNGKYDQMPTISKLLTAGVQGVKASTSKSGQKTKVMLHLDRGYSWSTQSWFYDTIIKNGFDLSTIDVQGISYYPFWDVNNSTLENFKDNVGRMAKKYGKGIVVAETDWPTKCSKASANIPKSLLSIPFSAEGQTLWVKKVADVVKGIEGGLGWGIMYWEPGWIDNTVSLFLASNTISAS
jgi:arabinogalactan endo-1,4-beta-galactosidase